MLVDAIKMGRVKRVNLTTQVMDSVKHFIVDNDLKPGDRLPTERDLVSELGVSRNILREALKSLEAVGLIEIKPGDGTYVREFDYGSVIDHISFAVSRKKQELKHFMYTREIIEVGALKYVVDHVTDEDVVHLRELLAGSRHEATMEQIAKADLAFHQAVLAITRNPVLTEFGAFLARFFMEAPDFRRAKASSQASYHHEKLVQALSDRNLVRAQRIMRPHILSWERYLDFDSEDSST